MDSAAMQAETVASPGSRVHVSTVARTLELTILMPCLNEAETLVTCITKAQHFLRSRGVAGEVLIADNGSTDGSVDLAESSGARVIHVPQRGYGAALSHGIEAARGQYVVMGDADDSYDFLALDAMLERLRSGDELVMGNRFRGGIDRHAMPWLHRYLGNPVLSFLGRLFFRVPIGDFHCGLRGFDRERMQGLALASAGMEFASEMVVKSKLHGLRIGEVPVALHPDGRSRPPHLKTWSDGWRHLKFLLLHSPRWLFVYPGALFLALGLALMLSLYNGPVTLFSHVRLDINSLIAGCVMVVVGAQAMSFGLMARRYAARTGILPTPDRTSRRLNLFSLEKSLLVAAVLVLGGMGGLVHSVQVWAQAGFGDMTYAGLIKPVSLSGTSMVVGLQLIFAAGLSALLDMSVVRRSRDA